MCDMQPRKPDEKLKMPRWEKPFNPSSAFFLNAMCALVLVLLVIQLLLFTWVMANPSFENVVTETSA